MNTLRRLSPAIIALMLVVMLGACGKKGAPQAPSDEPNTYPRNYPSE